MTVDATVTVCTRNRPDGLRTLLASIGRSRFRSIERPELDVLIVVNEPKSDGYQGDELSALCGWPVRVVFEPRAGVSFARNASIAHRSPDARWMLCVDDDEIVTPSWLERHLAFAETTTADVVTAPVLTIVPGEARPWVRSLWTTVIRHDTGHEMQSFLGGNVLFRSSLFDELDDWYDESQALSTGDDRELGIRIVAAGHRIVWNDGAIAWEPVHPDRLTTSWLAKRFLSYGGGRAIAARRVGRRQLVAELPVMARMVVASSGDAVRHHDAAAAGQLFAAWLQLFGFIAGSVGWRVRDYRQVTPDIDVPS